MALWTPTVPWHGDIAIEGSGDPVDLRPLLALCWEDRTHKSAVTGARRPRRPGRESEAWFTRLTGGYNWRRLRFSFRALRHWLGLGRPAMGIRRARLRAQRQMTTASISISCPARRPGDPIAAVWNPPVPYYALENTAVTGPGRPEAAHRSRSPAWLEDCPPLRDTPRSTARACIWPSLSKIPPNSPP